jgi:hypothetical protein
LRHEPQLLDHAVDMSDDTWAELNAGLSEDEKADLDQMITAFRSQTSSEAAVESNAQPQLEDLAERIAQLGEMVLKFDDRLNALVEILRLSHQKSELIKETIDTLIASINNR